MNISQHYSGNFGLFRQLISDLQCYLARIIKDHSGSRMDALLYRARRGENPYDFSIPQNQKSYLTVSHIQWR